MRRDFCYSNGDRNNWLLKNDFHFGFPPCQVNCRWKNSSKVPRATPPSCGCYSATPVARVNSDKSGQCAQRISACVLQALLANGCLLNHPSYFADKTPLPDRVCVCVSERTSPRSPTNTSAVLLRQLRSCFPVMLPFTLHILNINRKVCLHAATRELNGWWDTTSLSPWERWCFHSSQEDAR